MVTEKELFIDIPYSLDRETKGAVLENLNTIYREYNRLWKRCNAVISKFKSRFSIDRIFIDGFFQDNFKDELRQEIDAKTPLGLSIDSLLQGNTTVECAGNPNWELFEDFLAQTKLKFTYQILPYLHAYLQAHKKSDRMVSFLTDWENSANLLAEGSLLDDYLINYECHGKQWSVETQLLPTKFGIDLLGDIRAKNAAERINSGLNEGENGVAYLLYAGNSPFALFRHSLPDIKLWHYPKLNEYAYNLVLQAEMLRKNLEIYCSRSVQSNPLLHL